MFKLNMMRTIIFFGFLFAIIIQAQSSNVFVVPKPQRISKTSEKFVFEPGQVGLHLLQFDSKPLQLAVEDLQREIKAKTGIEAALGTESKYNIRIGNPEKHENLEHQAKKLQIWPGPRIDPQGYVLYIGNSQILILASHDAGLFYGIQTLKQLIRASEKASELPGLHIVDWPELRYRGMQDDISRGPVPTLDYMKLQVRRCAEMKLNLMSYYVEHVVKTEQYADFAPANGSISIAQWKELDDYARMHFVQLMGNFQSLGHFEKIMAFPQYRHLGETDRMISPVIPG